MTKPAQELPGRAADSLRDIAPKPPQAIARRGIHSVSESTKPEEGVRAGDALVRYFGADLIKEFVR